MKITYWLILVLVGVFLAELAFPAAVEMFAFSAAKLFVAPWTLITAMFIHADLSHLLSNLVGL